MTRVFVFCSVLIQILSLVYTYDPFNIKSSLTFVFDVTSSMKPVRMQVEENALAIYDAVMESSESFIDNFILVTFADTEWYPLNVVNVTKTKNKNEFKDSLALDLRKGGDCPEHSMSGIQKGIEESLPASTIYLFTDATAKDYDKYEYIRSIALEKQIQLIFIITKQCKYTKYPYEGYAVYERLAKDTSGQVFNLHRNQTSKIIEYIKTYVSSRRILFAALNFEPGKGHTFNYTTDHATNDTTLAISCFRLSLNIVGPDNATVEVTNLVDLQNVTVVKVNETKIGVQTVTVDCESDSRVIATARSYIQFRHGFSAFRPVSLNDTTIEPSPNGKTHLLIQVKGNFKPEFVKLLDVSNNLIPGQILHLSALDNSNKLFVTELFEPPPIMFRIVVFGVNLDHNETIFRIVTSFVKLQNFFGEPNGTTPAVTIEGSPKITVEIDTPLQLKCFVTAYPKPNITWNNNGVILETDVYDYKLPYEYVSVYKIEKTNENTTYSCIASNALGIDTKEIIVQAEKRIYFMMLETPEDKIHDVSYNNEAKFICKVDAYPPAQVNWYKNGHIIIVLKDEISVSCDGFELTIKHMQLGDEGKYVCEVKNSYHNNIYPFEVKITGVAKPKISASPNRQQTTENSNIKISCRIEEGTPKPMLKWFYKDSVSSDFHEIKESSDQEDLSLTNVQRNDTGTYKCVASNGVGSDTMESTLVVEYPPAVDDGSVPVPVEAGTDVTLACSADGVPEPVVVWRKDNTTLTDPKFISNSDHSLVFKADLEDSGDYECHASNKLGFDIKTVSVEVLKKPTILINESDPIDAEYDEPLNITCEVLGYPKPDIVWTDITNAADLEAVVEEKRPYRFISSLFIEKVTANVKYQCKANNSLGDGTHEVTVKTVRKPYFIILVNPEDKVYDVAYSTAADFHCEVDAYPSAVVNWFKNGLIISSNVNISVSPDGFVLTIKHMQLDDEGKYTCKVKNSYNDTEYPFEVKITGVAKPKISASPNRQQTTENSNIKISCRIEEGTPKPMLKWFYKDSVSSDFHEIKESSDQEDLSLTNVQRNDTGTYKCVASNGVGSDTMESTLVVEYPPAVDDGSMPVPVEAGTDVTLACSADGVPEPVVVWRKDNTTLTNPKFISNSDHSLVFEADLEDSGDYECHASNKLGFDIKTVFVEVLKKPTVLINISDTIDAEYDEPLNITCEVLGYPKPDIVWTDITNAAELEAVVEEQRPYLFISSLYIERVTANVKYQCKANNSLGDGTHEVTVKTVRKPYFIILVNPEDKVYAVAYSTAADFHCEVDAYPSAVVNWYKNGLIISSNANISVSSDGFALTIKHMQLGDEGKYTCKVKNSYNDTQYPFEVKVTGVAKPKISASPNRQQTTENSNIKISCRIEEGTPKPMLKWFYKDSVSSDFHEIKESSDQEDLSLTNVQRNDTGTYKCVASNGVGSDTMESTLVVEYPPAVDDGSVPVPVEAGTDVSVTLACSADGVPEPVVVWRKDNTTLTDPKFISNSDHSLVFEADLEDSGDYECHASNKLGFDIKTVSVEVLKKPTVLINISDTIDAEYDEPLNITCEVLGYPKPDIVWTDITNAAELEAAVEEQSPYLFVSSLYIERVTANVKYQCKANNSLGDGTHEVTVKTVRKPYFIILANPEDKVYDVAYSTAADFHCEVDAYPSAVVNWYKNGLIISSNANISVSSDGFVLTIKHMRLSDEGKYTCKVKNLYNDTEYPFEVKITGVAKPKISAVPNRQQTTENSDIKITCRIEEGTPKPMLKWFYKDSVSSDFHEIKESSDQEDLSLTNVQRNDTGTYKCVASNGVGSDTMESTLVVEYPPAVDDGSVPVPVEAGTDVTLACSADGVPEPVVVWRKDNTTLTDPKFISNSDHSLVFEADLEDSGDYECHASNKLGFDIKTVSVEVLKKPTVLINISDTIDAEYDEPLNITCEVLGYPKPDIVWTDITNAAELEAVVEEQRPYLFTSSLYIERVTANVKYQCKANNSLGDGTHEVTVKTVRKPYFIILANPEDKVYDVAYSTAADFHCEVDAYPSAVVNWYKNGLIISSNANISVSSDGFVLTIKHMRLGDEGKYTCKVKNSYNDTEYPFEVKITGVAKPKISAVPNRQQTTENSDIKITCRIEEGTPKPMLKWFYKDSVSSDFHEIKESSDQEDLSLTNVQRNDTGTYKCVASNGVGSDTMESTLVVEYPPAVDDGSVPVPVEAGTDVTLACSADGVPEPVVVWRKDNTTLTDPKFISNSDHSLVFEVDLEDSGDYECHASNKLGFDIKTVSVEVLKKPTVLINISDTIDAEYDEPLNITCEVLGYPKPDIVWTDITNAAELEAAVEEQRPYLFVSSLYIERVTANVKYQCKANNSLGDGTHEVTVKTVRKPYFIILANPEDKVYDVAYSTAADFHCEVDAYPSAVVNWYKNGLIISSNANISVSSDGFVLTIKHMRLSDEGKYTCKVKNLYNDTEYPFEVKITGVAKPKISAVPNRQQTTENSDIKITCRIEEGTPKPMLKWFYKDSVSSDFHEIKESSDQEVLSLTNVQRNDTGTYKCVASNGVGSNTMESTLVVEYPPAVDDGSVPVPVEAGTDVTLACSADGVPEPVVVWRKDNTTLTDPKFISNSDHSLVFEADLEDSGDYECHASNKLGFDIKTVSVEVLKKPTVLINISDTIDAEYDEPLNITCEVLGYPKPDIVWTDITNAAELEAAVEEQRPYVFISSLYIERVTANVKYQCKANNSLGDGTHEVTVKTVRKPYFIILANPEDKVYDVAYSTAADFHCEVDAYPSAVVNWYKNDLIISSNANISVSSDGFVLTIKHMQLGDEGKYTCKVKNSYNDTEYPFEVKITGVVKPKISATLKILNVLVNSDTKINCRIEAGKPYPSIQWYYKDNTNKFVEIKHTTDEDLLLTNIKIEDQGTYKCIAQNIMGSDVMEIDVIVEYAPSIDIDSETITAVAGNMLKLKCPADGFPPPNVEWKRDDLPLTDFKFVTSANHDLTFNADLDDKGVFKCIASNKWGSATKTVNIEVEKQPTVTIDGDSKQRVDFGDRLHLKCNVIGNPAPDIWWTDISNGVVLSSSTTTVTFPYEFLSILSIDKAVESATYQCEAKNVHGSSIAAVDVQAVRKKHFSVVQKPKDTTIPYNTEGKLFCKIDAYPKAKISWYHESDIIKNMDGFKVSADGSTLTIEKMQPNQAGNYYCKASNTDDTKWNNVTVSISRVESPKVFKRRNYNVKEGDSIYLDCKVRRGIPKPTIKWLIRNKTTNRYVEIPEAKNQERYQITNVRRGGNTMYGCQVDNFLGSDSVKISVQIEYAPTIKDDKTIYSEKAGTELIIPCSVDGKPDPTVTWSKNPTSTLDSETDHSLKLKVSLADTGTYTCKATNIHGTAIRTVNIGVYTIRIANSGENTIEIDEFDSLELECIVYGKPRPRVEWFFEGTPENPKNETVVMPLDDMRYDQRGRYTCVASNDMGGRVMYTYNVDVYTAVKIHNKDKTVEAVVGDLVLKIHCNATGNPKPYYQWTKNGVDDEEKSDTFTIRSVEKKLNSSEIICEAINDNDERDIFKFKVLILESPSLNNPNTTIKVPPGSRLTVACPIAHKRRDYLRWYKNGKLLPSRDLVIYRKSDAGIYTCRVSNSTKSESANVIIAMEAMLKFVNTAVQTSLSLGFEEMANLDCSAVGDPVPKVSWSFSGKIISSKDLLTFKMKQALQGRYTCEVTNDYDTIFRTFDVTLNECVLKINPDANKQPLILTQHFSWPAYQYEDGLLYMPKQQTVLLVCQNTDKLNISPYSYAYAYCKTKKNGVQLEIDGHSKDYSDIYCTQEVKPNVKWTTSSCYGPDSEKVKIAYEVLHRTVEIYEICMDLSYDTPFYAKQNMHIPLAESVPMAVPWFNDKLKHNFDMFYDTDEQIRSITAILGRPFPKRDRCVFTKRQLVNPLDVFPGLPQRATFSHLNVVPHWSTCSSTNWEELESRVRKLARSTNEKLTVWTGVAEGLKMKARDSYWANIFLSNRADMSSQNVSTYIWKVVQAPAKKSSVAIVQLNIPDITLPDARTFVKCKDVCHQISWMKGNIWSSTTNGYIFCCYLREFEKLFGYMGHNIFGSGMDKLLQ